jgi:hypothetical protein
VLTTNGGRSSAGTGGLSRAGMLFAMTLCVEAFA